MKKTKHVGAIALHLALSQRLSRSLCNASGRGARSGQTRRTLTGGRLLQPRITSLGNLI